MLALIPQILLVTGASIACSVAMTWFGSQVLDYPFDGTTQLMAVICPLVIAPLVSCALVIQQEKLRRLNAELHEANATIAEIARRDSLTGLLNRRAFMEAAARAAEGFSALLLIDIDHFKSLNDTHGHPAGDAALAAIGEAIRDVVGEAGIVARMGGEEFAVFLANATPASAARLGEDVRARIATTPVISPTGSCIRVTASLGLGILGPSSQFGDLYGEADRRLYAAKRAGRNRLCGAGVAA